MDAGVRYIQLDSPRYTHMVSEEGRANLRRVGLDTETWLGQMIAMDNALAEYDSPRAGSFEPLRFVPDDKTVVLGLITTKQPELEDEDEVKRRIDEASHFMPLNRLALSPQCGFASTLPGNKVTEADQRAKLELVGRVARDVWG